jgi:hypothetical protein
VESKIHQSTAAILGPMNPAVSAKQHIAGDYDNFGNDYSTLVTPLPR